MEQHDTGNTFSEQDWAEMEDAHECDGKVDGCEGCAFCAPMEEYTHQQEYQAAVMFGARAMARRLGLYYLDPGTAASMWSAVPNLPSIVARGDLEALATLIQEHSYLDPWEHPYTPESIRRVQASRKGGRK